MGFNTGVGVTKSDTVDLPWPCDALWVGGAGNVAVVLGTGPVVTFTAVTAGALLPVRATRVMATGTTATNLVALRGV